jgi:hypothetical protein
MGIILKEGPAVLILSLNNNTRKEPHLSTRRRSTTNGIRGRTDRYEDLQAKQ